jgi:small subunit ribosomal protein S1
MDLSRDRSEQRTDRFAAGEKIDAKVISVSRKESRLSLSIKALEFEQEKEAMEQYGSTDAGATLGDILGKALEK